MCSYQSQTLRWLCAPTREFGLLDIAERRINDNLGRDSSSQRWQKLDFQPAIRSFQFFDRTAYSNGVALDFSRPGKPTDNAFIESFNGSVRAECLNENWFLSLDDAKAKMKAWRIDYNEQRPHSALGNLAPGEFASSGQGTLAR